MNEMVERAYKEMCRRLREEFDIAEEEEFALVLERESDKVPVYSDEELIERNALDTVQLAVKDSKSQGE